VFYTAKSQFKKSISPQCDKMWKYLKFNDLFVLIFAGICGLVASAPRLDPGNHIATDHQLVIRSSEGHTMLDEKYHLGITPRLQGSAKGQMLLMGTQSENQFRAETRDANNEVKGVYSWLDALGNEHTVAFNSGKDGYHTMPIEKSGIELPPFPYGLYGDRPKDIQARTLTKLGDCVEPGSIFCDDMVVIGSEEDVIAKQGGDATSIITTTEDPFSANAEIKESEDNKGLEITEATPLESSRPGPSIAPGHGQVAVDGGHSVTSVDFQYDTKLKLPRFDPIQQKVHRMPKVLIFPLVTSYQPYSGYPMHYPLKPLVTQPQFLRPQPLQPLYTLFSKKIHK